MLYSEFLENTGGHDNSHNYKVYKSLEALYMDNDNMTKADIYKAGKTLIDNTPSEATKALIEKAKSEIETAKSQIEFDNERIETLKCFISITAAPDEIKEYKRHIKSLRDQIKAEKSWIARQKFFLNGIM